MSIHSADRSAACLSVHNLLKKHSIPHFFFPSRVLASYDNPSLDLTKIGKNKFYLYSRYCKIIPFDNILLNKTLILLVLLCGTQKLEREFLEVNESIE